MLNLQNKVFLKMHSCGVAFPKKLREAKTQEFINLEKGSMVVKEYILSHQLSRYAPNIVCDMRIRMSTFMQ